MLWSFFLGCGAPDASVRTADPAAETGAPVGEDDPSETPTAAATVALTGDDPCVNPCRVAAATTGPVAAVRFAADGWPIGEGTAPDFAVVYTFSTLGLRQITAEAVDAAGAVVATDARAITVLASTCLAYDSVEEEYAPVQLAAAGVPTGAPGDAPRAPAAYTRRVAFSGTPGQPAGHEGIDLIHDNPAVDPVSVQTPWAGVVAYVRLGCPETDPFAPNQDLRECGSGWGNHVVVDHGGGVFTRAAHLRPDSVSVRVGDVVAAGDPLGQMGNSGRSELRHLHLEVGTSAAPLDACAPAQSMDAVYDPALLGL
jgi:murein DD-endopeptidase MepM/ murein hydrolase activator NlpD